MAEGGPPGPPGAGPGPPMGGPPGATAPGPFGMPMEPLTDDQLITAVIEALGKNRTAPARTALRQIVSGQKPTFAPDSTVVGLALTALLNDATPEDEALLVAAVTTPERVRTAPPAGGMGPTEVQTQAVTAIDAHSCRMRRVFRAMEPPLDRVLSDGGYAVFPLDGAKAVFLP